MLRVQSMVPFFTNLLAWRSSRGTNQPTAPCESTNPTPKPVLLEDNSIYKYYLSVRDQFGSVGPSMEIILRDAARNDGPLQKHQSLGRTIFTDPKTDHVLTLDLVGDIVSD